MRLKTIIILVSVCFLFHLHESYSEDSFRIAALFSEESTQSEQAFYQAVNRYNSYHGSTFEYSIHYVPRDIFGISKAVCNILQEDNGVVAIVGPQFIDGISITQSICEKMEIPHIQVNWKPSAGRFSDFSLNFYPDTDLLSKGLETIVRHMNFKKYVIIIEEDEALVRLQGVLKIPGTKDFPVTIRKIQPNGDVRKLFKEFKNSTITKIILDCEASNIINYLLQAKSVDMLGVFNHYLLTNLDAHTLDFSVLETAANITTIRIVNPSNPVLQNTIADWSIAASDVKVDAALMNDATFVLMDSITELHEREPIISKPLSCSDTATWDSGLRLISYMKRKSVNNSTITGLISFDGNGQRNHFSLEVLKVVARNMTVLATWEPENPKNLTFTSSASSDDEIIEHLKNITLIVSSRIGRPYLMKYTDENGEEQLEGYCYDLIQDISQFLNISMKIVLTADNKYGNYDPKTKGWNGIISDLLEHRAHLGVCDLTINRERREVVDFSMNFMNLGIGILYRDAPEGERNIFAFMEPLSSEVWIFTVTAYLGVSIMFYLVARMAPGDWENPHPCDENPEELENIWGTLNCMWLTLGAIMNQGCDILPKGIPSRMAASMWWFFALLMTSSYTANLAAFLTKQQQDLIINNVEALAKSGVKYGVVDGGSTQTFFRDSNESLYQRMWTAMQEFKPSVFEKGNSDGVKRVLNSEGAYAFFMESTGIEYEIERNCSLKQVGDLLDNKGYGIAMPFNAPYRGLINKAILSLQELGNLTRLKDKWWKEMYIGTPCEKSEKQDDDSLKLENVGGVFLVLGIGVTLAIITAIVEFLWNVQNVAVQEHISYWDALIVETKFAINIWIDRKATKPDISESSSSSTAAESDTRSIAQKVLHGASSFLNLDKISIISKKE